MRAIDYLREIRKLDEKIIASIDQIDMLKALATRTTTVLSGDRVQTSGSQEKMADCVAEYTDRVNALNAEIDQYCDEREKARNLIFSVCDPECIRLLTMRYLGTFAENGGKAKYHTWEEIAVEMGYTYQWVAGGLHQRALSQVQKELDKQEV